MAHKATALRTQNGYANTTLCLHQSIEGKSFIINREDLQEIKMLVWLKGVEILKASHARSYTHACEYPA